MWNKGKHINKLLRHSILLLFVGYISIASNAQEEYNPYVKSFDAVAIDGRVYLSWTTRAGFTCQDIHIEVSKDSIRGFERRGTYYGVCGDASERSYTFVLENPDINTLNYLRLELGNIGYSNTISVMVIKAEKEVLILPHPIVENSTIFFENKENANYTLTLYNDQGNVVLTAITRQEEIQIGNFHLPSGIFYYHLFAEDKKQYRGKFLIL